MDQTRTKTHRRVDVLRVAAEVPCDPKTAHKHIVTGVPARAGLGIRIEEVAKRLGIHSEATGK